MLQKFQPLFALFFLLFSIQSISQNHQWSFNIGGASSDLGHVIYSDNKGYIYAVGYFTGSNIDFDPSPTNTFFLSSTNGSRDGYVSKYTTDGKFVWAFSFGGSNLDEANSVAVDGTGNIYVTGYFRGSGVDFDPSATGTALLNSNGDEGGDPGYGGDIFVAKYNSQGKYQWAFNVGATSLGDNGMVITCDNAGNIYTSGYFRGSPDFDPAASGVHTLDAGTGTMYVAKYNTNGEYQWAFNLGEGNVDNAPFGIKIDASGNIYLTGYFQGTNQDFDPSVNGISYLTSNGGFDIFAAKYNSTGEYQWAFAIGGGNTDVGRDIEIDNSGNVYIVGDFDGSNIDFNPSPSAATNLTSNNRDVFIAKYNASGQYQWAKDFGGSGSDISWSLAYTNNNIYITGSFQGTMNFNPGPTTDNLVSNGANDFYMTKFDVNGNYVCAFNVGGSENDDAYKVAADNSGNLYLTGILSSSNTDFDPGSGTKNLSTNGGSDIFIAKYNWPDNPKPTGSIKGNTICSGKQGQLTFTATSGAGPFTIEYGNASGTYTQTNVQSGVPFNVSLNPTVTTVYNLISIRDATVCPSTNNVSGITGIITVSSCETTSTFTAPDTVCVNTPVNITNTSSNASSYYWSFCGANSATNPTGTNIGNFGFSSSVFIDFAFDNNNYYGFVTNNSPGKVIRLDFGNSLLNTPTTVDLGNVGGVIPEFCEGIQMVKNEGKWYAIIVGGVPEGRIVKLEFGTSLTSTPVGTNWGNIGNLAYPVDLHVFQDGATWYGFTINAYTSTITRFNFSGSFNNTPTGVNLGNIGNLNYPTGIYAINNNNNWNVFITNAGSGGQASTNSSLTRLDFGNSLLNTPTGVNIGNPGNTLSSARDLIIYKSCNEIFGYVTNYSATNDIVRLDFNNNLTATPSAVSLGNTGNLSFPHSISKVYRVGNDLYSFIVNVNNNTLSRLKFPGCTNANIANSTLQNPPPVTYNAPGIYNISLITDEGLSTQSSFCKQVVVLPPPVFQPLKDTSLCLGQSITLKANATGATSYTWSPATGLSNPNIKNPVASPIVTTQYIVTATGSAACSANDTVLVSVLNGISADFTYRQNTCSPNSVQFFSSNQNASSYSWDFGNGQTVTGSPNPVVSYNSYGNYIVKLLSQGSTCKDSVQKIIPISVAQANVIFTADTTICTGTSLKLATDSGISFCWKPDASISNTNIANTTITPTKNTTYYFTSQAQSNDLVANGDFSQGNTGFTSDYNSASPNTKEAEYYVANDSHAWNINFNSCTEHTTVSGKMMMVNGSSAAGAKVWGESISISPNTNYAFSVWIESLAALNPANLRFSINGIVLGDNINAGNVACQWKQVFTTWNSGGSTTAAISIVNNNTIADGNDFALDDISFAQVFLKQDSLKVNVTPAPVIRTIADTAICKGNSVQLNTSGATFYNWSPAAGLSNPNDQNPIATPAASATYIVSAYNSPGCVGTDTVKIDVLKSPDISLSNDTTICAGTQVQLTATGGVGYQWFPATGLSNPNTSNPLATPGSATVYSVTVTNNNGCSSKDSVAIAVALRPTVNSIKDTSACFGTPVILNTSSAAATVYHWSPAAGLSDTSVASPVAIPLATTDYIVTASSIKDCEAKDTVRITILSAPSITKSNDTTVCKGGNVSLFATGGTAYQWTPANTLSGSQTGNPTATADTTTVYKVSVTGSNGCQSNDSVKVSVKPVGNFSIYPASANICLNDTITLTAGGGDEYVWLSSFASSPYNAATSVNPDATTTFKVRIYDSVCKHTDTLSSLVTVNPLPQISIQKSNDIDCTYPTAQLTAVGGSTYSWTPASSLNNANIGNPVVSPNETTTYVVKATNSQGCFNYDSMQVVVKFTGAAANGYGLPTAFTPNSDGKNDCFGVKSWGAVTRLEFSVYNRWGERVFYTTSPSGCWDGTYKSVAQGTGGFVYYIKAKTICGGEISRKGTVVLIR